MPGAGTTHAVEYIYEGAVGLLVIEAVGQPEIGVADRPLALFSISEVDNTGRSLPKFQAVPLQQDRNGLSACQQVAAECQQQSVSRPCGHE